MRSLYCCCYSLFSFRFFFFGFRPSPCESRVACIPPSLDDAFLLTFCFVFVGYRSFTEAPFTIPIDLNPSYPRRTRLTIKNPGGSRAKRVADGARLGFFLENMDGGCVWNERRRICFASP